MASFPVSHSTQLTPEEALVHDFDHVSIHPEPQSQSHCLVVKILSPKTLKVDWIQKAMTEAWALVAHFLSLNITWDFFGFSSVVRVTVEESWRFVADTIGDLIEVHLISLYDSVTPFMRVRVLLDTTKPLHRGMNVHFKKLSLTKWLKFLYEGIQNYCYYCGKLDHTFNKCGKFLLHCDNHPYPPSLSYKDVLRAPAKSIYKKSIFELSTSIPFEEQPSLANTGHPTIEDHNDHFTVPTVVEPTPPFATSPPPPAFTHTTSNWLQLHPFLFPPPLQSLNPRFTTLSQSIPLSLLPLTPPPPKKVQIHPFLTVKMNNRTMFSVKKRSIKGISLAKELSFFKLIFSFLISFSNISN
uniref:Zinc knuckle CX2CX4HX4C domain-containing protein n=1 Tax=Cannabis sativa TaxID=3483 RepID=A0A803PUL4_CANSA